MVFWPWSKDHLLKNELNLIKNRLELMAKTIRSHPTSHVFVLKPICWTILIFSGFGPNTDQHFVHFPTSLHVKRLAPQRKKDAHGPSLHIRFLSKCHFLYCIYHHFWTFWAKPTFFNYCLILIVLCISDSNMGDPQIIMIPKYNFHLKMIICVCGAFLAGISFCCFLCVLAQRM